MLKNFPEEVINLWNNGEIRGMVLLSLLLQTILIVFGSRRKTIARSWIRILVWSTYLSADMVATVALVNLARSQGDSSGDDSKKSKLFHPGILGTFSTPAPWWPGHNHCILD
jgi:hypothetical protein